MTRSEVSGVSSTLAIARLAWAGKAANTKPSITKTSPSAARKSDMPVALSCAGLAGRGRRRGRCGRRRRRTSTRLAVRVVEVAEEVGVGLEQQPRIGVLHAGLV